MAKRKEVSDYSVGDKVVVFYGGKALYGKIGSVKHGKTKLYSVIIALSGMPGNLIRKA